MSVLSDLEDDFQGRTVPTDVEIQSALRHWKNAVRLATTAAGTLATDFEEGDTVDGTVLVAGDRLLVKDQADPIENGIYNVVASGPPSRASDQEATTDAAAALVFVIEGTANGETLWYVSDASPTEVAVDEMNWTQFLAGSADGCSLPCGYDAQNFTPASATVGGMIAGIDTALASGGAPAAHAASHTDGTDDIDGDHLTVDFTPANYTPSIAPAEADDVDDLAAHLKGIDDRLANAADGVVQLDGSGDATIPNDLLVTRDFTVNPLGVGGADAFNIDGTLGDATVGNDLDVGNDLTIANDLLVNTDKFVVTGATGSLDINGNFGVDATTGNVTTAGTVDGRDLQTDGSKLDGIEAGATADQTAAEVSYSNTTSGLAATDVQAAIDEIDATVDGLGAPPAAASQAEVDAGTVANKYVAPQTLQEIAMRAPVTLNSAGVGAYTISDSAVTSATGFAIRGDLLIDQQDATSDTMAYTVGTAEANSVCALTIRAGQDATFTGSGVTVDPADMPDATGTDAAVSNLGGSAPRVALLLWVTSTYVVLLGGDPV